jgi:hypothetical protein
MMKRAGLILLVSATIAAIFATSETVAATDCGKANYSADRAKLSSLLSVSGYAAKQRDILLRKADIETAKLDPARLNQRGRNCGIHQVRAHVLACTTVQLRTTLPSVAGKLAQETSISYWGIAKMTRGELLFFGMFTACKAGALENLFN